MKIKNNTKVLVSALGLLFSSSISFSADTEFTQFKNQQAQGVQSVKDEFAQYKKELEDGFAAYKKAYKAAYEADKKAVKNIWGDYRPGDKKSWVQYDESGVRKSVNFESGEVELEIIVDEKYADKKAEDALKRKILALLTTTRLEAFKGDSVSQSVEKKIANLPHVKTAKVSNTPVMSAMIPEVRLKDTTKIRKISQTFTDQSKTDVRTAKKPGKKVVRVKFKIPTNAPEKSKQFIAKAKKIADKEELPLTLVMAIMETESAFNPMAKSGVPAYGLMQIVPRSAGQDATKYLFGKAKILSPSYLYDSDKNIEIGGAYLHILYFNYLNKIEDPVSRLYCAIAAYNTGAGNVAKAFTGKKNINKASVIINKLTPKQVYQKLRKQLPYAETQHYVKKVANKLEKYQHI
ncbi:MAG: transglycosylase SLT domain-containing protein [Gammaproteobacteria bacterium]|nr:transglycosylase SLT domain-containing protein [Gammaproteobacteria bacterium]